jgi:hypothetical protein
MEPLASALKYFPEDFHRHINSAASATGGED